MPLNPGSRLGPYEIVAPLGAGGMGEVYRARDTSLKREVAIKVLPSYWSHDPDRLRRFELEAQAAAALNHPNIVSIFSVGEHDGAPYIVTELLHGETLRERLRHGPLRLREVLNVAVDIARALGTAHDAGVVHRDLKPENIFLTKERRVKVLDFGLAKLKQAKDESTNSATVTTPEETHPGQVMGTVGYMSPEQVRGQPADARSDIFALGVMLYEMLTSERAFHKATTAETMTAILNEDPPPVSQIAHGLPPGLEKIVNRCLSKSPEQRFQHASDLAFALEALSDSSSVAVAAVPQPQALRQNRAWLAALAAVLLAAAILYWVSRPPAVPSIESITQLTDDGVAKWVYSALQTDGSRVYFNEGTVGNLNVAQVSVTGGATGIIPTTPANAQIVGLAPEGSPLLALHGPFNYSQKSVWLIPLPTGTPRQLVGIVAVDATFSPDGRILFSDLGSLYVVGKEGANPRKLLDVGGFIGEPRMSPDGKHILFTHYANGFFGPGLVQVDSDGANLQPLLSGTSLGWTCCTQWTPDGKYIIFVRRGSAGQEIWTMPMKPGFLRGVRKPMKLTAGPLSYVGPVVSRDGNQVFVIGVKKRGEVVRFDTASKQFVPFLSGISAFDPTFSADGTWVAYTAYPDNTLWRSRSNGTDRLQLTFAPSDVAYPFISPDGRHVAYGDEKGAIYVISMDGGQPEKLADANCFAPNWSADGKTLVFADYKDNEHPEAQLLDVRTGKRSVVPGSRDLTGFQWVSQDALVASDVSQSSLKLFDLRTQGWSVLVEGKQPGNLINWSHSPDYHYVYYTTGGDNPKVVRVHLSDRKSETVASLKELRLAPGPDENTQISVAPDGSAVFTRDVGTQEIYALTVKWP
jgi:serine/threonine protein kinase/Tol biopolymer transport system component